MASGPLYPHAKLDIKQSTCICSMESSSQRKVEDVRKDRVQPPSPVFVKSALVALLLALFIYGYRVCFFCMSSEHQDLSLFL